MLDHRHRRQNQNKIKVDNLAILPLDSATLKSHVANLLLLDNGP